MVSFFVPSFNITRPFNNLFAGSQNHIEDYKRLGLKRRGESVGYQTAYGMDAHAVTNDVVNWVGGKKGERGGVVAGSGQKDFHQQQRVSFTLYESKLLHAQAGFETCLAIYTPKTSALS